MEKVFYLCNCTNKENRFIEIFYTSNATFRKLLYFKMVAPMAMTDHLNTNLRKLICIIREILKIGTNINK